MSLPSRDQAIALLTAPGQPYELQFVQDNGRTVPMFRNAPSSLRELFAQHVSELPFIVYGDERLSFAQAYQRAAQIAHLLVHDYGIGKGDRVAISMRNYPEWILAFTAITSIGAITVAMNSLWQPDEMAYGLTDSGAKVLFADQERLDRLAQCAPIAGLQAIAVRPTAANASDLMQLIDKLGAVTMPAVEVAPTDAASIFYTSGSTGHPKGVISSHRNILAALLSWELDGTAEVLTTGVAPPTPTEQAGTLLAVPLFHATGSHAVYLMSYRLQRRVVCMYKWDPQQAADLIDRERLTSFIAPAAMTGDLVRAARELNRDLSSLMLIGGGGAPRAPEQVRQIDATFAQARPGTGWGMTETNAIGTGIGGADYLQRPASSGRCSALLELKIVDDNGRALPAGERGELLVRGTSVFGGYWNRAELNATLFDDGWFRTGDVAYLDDEGYLFIVDRIKDLIIRGGENIGCGQVEAALLMHPDVHEAAVYSVPDERLGEEVGATVFGKPTLREDELREFLAAHLARFELPRYIFTASAPLPRTPSGKILKRQLREQAIAALARDRGA
jgi:long-chain acyl-CoA synthetase